MFASDRIVSNAIGGVLVAVSTLLVLCNWWDWDFFFTSNEVDRRAWLIDHELPLWSYQFCGGVTRIGDPQSFGLSPLFAVVLLFGSFWGTKLAVLLSFVYGWWISGRLLQLMSTAGGGPALPTTVAYTLATLLVSSNFFLWHLSVGHFTFLSFYFALGIVYYTLAAYSRSLGRAESVVAILVVWQHFSGGFFHSTAHLLVPFYLAFGLFWLASVCFGSDWRSCLRGLGRTVPFHVLGVLLASYKLIAVWRYRMELPDALSDLADPRYFPEMDAPPTLLQAVAAQTIPTFGEYWPVSTGAWGVHEWNAFSILPIALLLLIVRGRSAARVPAASGVHSGRNPLARFVWIYAAVAASFVIGGSSEVAPFNLLNQIAFGGALRIASRFGVGITLSIALACAVLWRRSRPGTLSPPVCLILLFGALVNLLTFAWIASVSQAAHLASLPSPSTEEMNTLQWISLWGVGPEGSGLVSQTKTSQMYPRIRAGDAIMGCYNPLPRPLASGQPPGPMIPMLDTDGGDVERACLEESSFTQNRVHIGRSCPERLCLHFNWINIHASLDDMSYDPERRLFCRNGDQEP